MLPYAIVLSAIAPSAGVLGRAAILAPSSVRVAS